MMQPPTVKEKRARTMSQESASGQPQLLQRKCSCGGTIDPDDMSSKYRSNKMRGNALSAKSAPTSFVRNSQQAGIPSVVHEVINSPGRPLDAGVRAYMEPRFRQNFGDVRVHMDSKAAASARSVGARAYTVGRNVVFGAGNYSPGDQAGRHLMAHELAHVVQQRSASSGLPQGIASSTNSNESEAESYASSIEGKQASRPTALSSATGPVSVQRQALSEEDPSSVDPDDGLGPAEVYDGDTPVNASPDPKSSTPDNGQMAGQTTLAQADPPANATLDPGPAAPGAEAQEQKGGGVGQKAQTKPSAPPTITKIEVDQAAQTMTVTWSDGTKEGPRPVSTGKGLPNTKEDPCKTQTEENCTPNGTFKVGTLGNGNTKNSHGDHMSWYTAFVDSRGIGIHNSQPVPGTPASHGCVRVGSSAADDAFAKKINKGVVPGTTDVVVSGKAATKPWKKAAKPKKK